MNYNPSKLAELREMRARAMAAGGQGRVDAQPAMCTQPAQRRLATALAG